MRPGQVRIWAEGWFSDLDSPAFIVLEVVENWLGDDIIVCLDNGKLEDYSHTFVEAASSVLIERSDEGHD